MIVGNPNQEIKKSTLQMPLGIWPNQHRMRFLAFGGYECLLAFPGVPSYNTIKSETLQLNGSEI